MEIEHWVEWLCPGTLFPEESNQKIETRDLSKIKIPSDAYAFRFYDIKKLEVTDELGEKHMMRSRTNISPRHIIGKVYSMEDIEEMNSGGEYDILIRNLERYGAKCAVLTWKGNWQKLMKDDVVIDLDNTPYHIEIVEPVIYKEV